MYFCFMYNPPSNSAFLKSLQIDYLDILEKEIAKFSRIGKIVIARDLNARTSVLRDL